MLSLKSVINEIYPAEVSAKVRQAMDIKAQDGEFLYPYIPYGYVKSKTIKTGSTQENAKPKALRKTYSGDFSNVMIVAAQ